MTEDVKREPLTDDEKEVAFAGWALAARGKAFVPNETHVPACQSMETRGWLRSQTLDSGDVAYEWTAAGETALGLHDLMTDRAAEAN